MPGPVGCRGQRGQGQRVEGRGSRVGRSSVGASGARGGSPVGRRRARDRAGVAGTGRHSPPAIGGRVTRCPETGCGMTRAPGARGESHAVLGAGAPGLRTRPGAPTAWGGQPSQTGVHPPHTPPTHRLGRPALANRGPSAPHASHPPPGAASPANTTAGARSACGAAGTALRCRGRGRASPGP